MENLGGAIDDRFRTEQALPAARGIEGHLFILFSSAGDNQIYVRRLKGRLTLLDTSDFGALISNVLLVVLLISRFERNAARRNGQGSPGSTFVKDVEQVSITRPFFSRGIGFGPIAL